MNTTALILAGGLGTRLHKYTQGLYPKILLSTGNQTFLDEVIDFWMENQMVSQMKLVFSEDSHISLVREYLNVFHPYKPITILKYSKTDGTFNTLFNLFNADKTLLESNLIISWSDILPKNKLTLLEKRGIKVFTDSNKIHRCSINSHLEIGIDVKEGNIPGLYNIRSIDLGSFIQFKQSLFQQFFKLNREVDFVSYLKWAPSVILSTEEIELTDIGDAAKYEKHINGNSIEQRWFNDIEFTNEVVFKRANNEYGKTVMESEIAFYNHIKETEASYVFPEIYEASNGCIQMENLKTKGYVTVNEYLTKQTRNKQKELLKAYNEAIKKIHKIDTQFYGFNADTYNEYIKVTIERYNKIQYFIPSNINSVNFTLINKDFYDVMDKLHKYLEDRKYQFAIIHGDTNSTNTLYNEKTKTIKFIDPRGKFGNSNLYGDTDYDYAKFLYGITGYDQFNLDKTFNFTIAGNSIMLPSYNFDMLDELTSDTHLKILVGLIWLKLPFYIKNNPNKIIASYFNGMYLLNKYLL